MQTALHAFLVAEPTTTTTSSSSGGANKQKKSSSSRRSVVVVDEPHNNNNNNSGGSTEYLLSLFEVLPAAAAAPAAAAVGVVVGAELQKQPPAHVLAQFMATGAVVVGSSSTSADENDLRRKPLSIGEAVAAHYNHNNHQAHNNSRPNPAFASTEEQEGMRPVHLTTVPHRGEACLPNERVIQVARYGRVYKRKTGWYKRTVQQLGGPPGTRFCRFCEAHLPLEAFYTHIKRFVCRRHHALRVLRTEQKQDSEQDPTRKVALLMWDALKQVKDVLGYAHVNFDYADIRALLIHAGLPFHMDLRLCPIDPAHPMRPRNVAAVTRTSFDLVMQTYTHMCSRGVFIAMVQHCNLFPKDMDVGWPERPRQDPTYRREDIDVGPLLAAEQQLGAVCPDSELIERLVAQESQDVPWVRDANHPLALQIGMRARWQQHSARAAAAAAAAAAKEGQDKDKPGAVFKKRTPPSPKKQKKRKTSTTTSLEEEEES